MSDSSLENLPKGWKSVPSDLGSDQTAFKGVQWGKAMTVSYTHLTLPTT